MKKILFFLLTIVGISGCSFRHVPIKGEYLTKPFEISSPKTFDEVWGKTIDMFAQNGISIKLIDKSSGLLVSDISSLTWSFENDEGKLSKPEAYVVIEKIIDPGPMRPMKPNRVTGDWNIRIKSDSSGSTRININLVNIKAEMILPSHNGVSETWEIQARSTGNFEKSIAEYIK